MNCGVDELPGELAGEVSTTTGAAGVVASRVYAAQPGSVPPLSTGVNGIRDERQDGHASRGG